MKLHFAVFLAICSMLVGLAEAQETPVLPDLAPRQVEITGDLTISFPSLRRQPLIGFNPPPTVPAIPDERRPYSETYKQVGADLPPSPLVPPAPPAVSTFASRRANSGRVTIQAGRYLDRLVDADVELLRDEIQTVTASVSYFGTDGHDNTPTGGSTGRDLFDADVRWRRAAGPGLLGLQAGLIRNSWSLVGATPIPGSLSLQNPERTASAVHLGAGWGSRPGARLPYNLDVKWTSSEVETDIFDPAVRVDPSTDRHENRLFGSGRVTVPVASWTAGIAASGVLSGLDESGTVSLGTASNGDARIFVASAPGRRLELEIGATLLAIDSDAQGAGTTSRSESFLVPSGKLRYWLSESTSFFAGSDPGLARHTSLTLLSDNPFVRDEPFILPDLYSMRGFAGFMGTSRYTEWEVQAGFDRAPSYGYHAASPTPLAGYSTGYFDRLIDEMDRYYVESSFALILSPAFHSGVGATVQQTELDATGEDVPFVSPLSVRGWIQGSGFDGQLDVLTELLFESARDRDTARTLETDDYYRFSLKARYNVRPDFAITLGLRHLFSEPDFFSGQPLEESAVHVGVGWRW